jgi:hypothetical protein
MTIIPFGQCSVTHRDVDVSAMPGKSSCVFRDTLACLHPSTWKVGISPYAVITINIQLDEQRRALPHQLSNQLTCNDKRMRSRVPATETPGQGIQHWRKLKSSLSILVSIQERWSSHWCQAWVVAQMSGIDPSAFLFH